jgi:hypothetical protein
MIVETKKGKLPVKYGMNAFAMFSDMTGKTMNEVMSSLGNLGALSVGEVLAFMFVGFADGARFANTECVIKDTIEVGDMIDEDDKLLSKMTTAFHEDSMADDTEEGDSKKK